MGGRGSYDDRPRTHARERDPKHARVVTEVGVARDADDRAKCVAGEVEGRRVVVAVVAVVAAARVVVAAAQVERVGEVPPSRDGSGILLLSRL